MILITGATGTIGSELVRLLARRGAQVRALTRDPSRARVPAGVELVAGDFGDPGSLARAAGGVKAVFLLSAPGDTVAAHDLAMVEAAKAAGVGKLVKLSAIGTGSEHAATNFSMRWHEPGEEAVRESGLDWTVLRPTTFASNALQWVAAVRSGAPIPNMTGTGTQGVVDPRDVSAVAAEALTGSALDGRTYTLTGPELLSTPDQVAALAAAVGRSLETVEVSAEVAEEGMRAGGMDPSVVEVALSGLAFVRAGRNAIVTDDVAEVLGRAPGTFEAWARDHAAAFS
ncbi:NAD(P)H-binding protein [Nonomuraea sp. NPDC046570]|uniref:NAD(P)H-binding protein n=1 Tax=Nonomuraea sp. NPDC046570 TaxID=3155255 RepID=UPI0033DAB05A